MDEWINGILSLEPLEVTSQSNSIKSNKIQVSGSLVLFHRR